ncbi:MAG: hypothetical protein FJX31_09640, partial [Alphaproteobacteria bacterium]|nr:hypothetical protein [Alphaproteobacteria bacterium]
MRDSRRRHAFRPAAARQRRCRPRRRIQATQAWPGGRLRRSAARCEPVVLGADRSRSPAMGDSPRARRARQHVVKHRLAKRTEARRGRQAHLRTRARRRGFAPRCRRVRAGVRHPRGGI